MSLFRPDSRPTSVEKVQENLYYRGNPEHDWTWVVTGSNEGNDPTRDVNYWSINRGMRGVAASLPLSTIIKQGFDHINSKAIAWIDVPEAPVKQLMYEVPELTIDSELGWRKSAWRYAHRAAATGILRYLQGNEEGSAEIKAGLAKRARKEREHQRDFAKVVKSMIDGDFTL